MPRLIFLRLLICTSCAIGAMSMTLARSGHAQQQTASPNFGAQPEKADGNWLTNRLPWNGKGGAAKPKTTSQRRRIEHREVSPSQRRTGQFSLARLAEKRGQIDAAKTMYQAMINKDPKDPAPYHRMGVIAAKQGEFKLAGEYMLHARKLNPRDPEVLRDLGYLYYKNDRLDDAENFYRQGLQIDPKNQGIANNYAMLLAEKQQYKQSLALFQAVNQPAEAHANMGFMLAQMGHIEKAEAYFNHALTLDRDLKSAAHGLMQTAELKMQVAAMKKASENAVAKAKATTPKAGVEASLSDEPATASRIAVASNNDAVKQVARIESKPNMLVEQAAPTTKSAPAVGSKPAVQVNPIRSSDPIRSNDPIRSSEGRSLSQNFRNGQFQSGGRQAIGTQPSATPGPARQRNTLRIRSSTSSAIQKSETASASREIEKNVATEPSPTIVKPIGQHFDWSTSQFPTSKPTWTPNQAKTEMPAQIVK